MWRMTTRIDKINPINSVLFVSDNNISISFYTKIVKQFLIINNCLKNTYPLSYRSHRINHIPILFLIDPPTERHPKIKQS